MTDIPKGSSLSLCIKDVIERVISERLKIKVKDFRMEDYERDQLLVIIDLVNEEYSKNPNRIIDKILWEDFYHWYNDYHN